MAYEESLATAGEEACDLSISEEEEESESEDGAGERGRGGAVDAMAESEVAEGAGAIGAIGEADSAEGGEQLMQPVLLVPYS